jgi:hypothetical protein
MSWPEALALTQQLMADPSSRVCTAVSGWTEPWPREAFILADLFDLTHQAHSNRNPKPYPRPADSHRKRSAVPRVSQRAIRAALAARGHGMN